MRNKLELVRNTIENVRGHSFKDITGMKFGMLTAIKINGKNTSGAICFDVECECGNITNISGTALRTGKSKSCGCFKKETIINNHTKYIIEKFGTNIRKLSKKFKEMKRRCYNPKNCAYKYYGAKGIRICDEWLKDRKSFNLWAIENGYKDGLTIDRIDSTKDYSPENCQWVTFSENIKRMHEARRKKKNEKLQS